MLNTNEIVTIKEYGTKVFFRVAKQLKEYKAPVYQLEWYAGGLGDIVPHEKFNGKMAESALIPYTNEGSE